MSDQRAIDTVKLYESEEAKVANFRSLHQRVADLQFPRDNQILQQTTPGEEKTQKLIDSTAVMASIEMASGLSQNLFVPGQRSFLIQAVNRELNTVENVKRWMSMATDIVHERMFSSNFILQFNENLRAIGVFGTGNLYSEYTTELNFKDYDIGSYIIIENSNGRVDGMLMKFQYTARQAFEKWGDNAGEHVLKAMQEEKNHGEKFTFIHKVVPRKSFNPFRQDSLGLPFESTYTAVKERIIVDEGGYHEFPYHVARWSKASNEVFGRGPGTFVLPDVRELQQMTADLKECANKHNNPPLEVVESFEGEVRTYPGAINYVMEHGAIRAVDRGVLGNYPVTLEMVEAQRELVRKAYFNDVFVQLANLKGDRRTTLEIRERIGEGLQRLGPPIGRIQEELLSPLITRTIFMLMRNGQLPDMPPELSGQPFEIEYVGRLALELKSHQARGAQQWIASVAEIETVFPGALDNIDMDSAIRRLGETFGVNPDDIATEEEVAAKRQARAEAQAKQEALQMAEMAAKGYGQMNAAPESGSPAGNLMEAMSG